MTRPPGPVPSTCRFGRRLAVLASVLVVGLPVPGHAQSADALLEEAYGRYVRSLEGIRDLRIEQEMFGMTTVTYFEKQTGPAGEPVLTPRVIETMGIRQPVLDGEEDDAFMGNPATFFRELAREARREGSGTLNGRSVHVLVVDDPASLGMDAIPPGEVDGSFEASRGTLHLDAADLVLLRMELEGQLTEGGETHPVSLTVDFSDYREVGGYLHPWSMRMSMDMPLGAVDLGDREEARAAMEEIREQLDQMPAEQRAMMESMFEGQMRALEEMLDGGEGGGMTLEVRTVDVTVNQGLPD